MLADAVAVAAGWHAVFGAAAYMPGFGDQSARARGVMSAATPSVVWPDSFKRSSITTPLLVPSSSSFEVCSIKR